MNKKELIIEVATRLFSENGFEKTSLASIRKEANVSNGLIYHHFKNKNELLIEIFNRATEIVSDINDSIHDHLTPKQKILMTIEGAFEQMEKDKYIFKLYLNVMLEPTTRMVLHDLIEERNTYLLDSAKKLFAHLPEKEQNIKSYLFVSDLDGIAINYIFSYKNYPLDLVKEEFTKRYT